MRNQKSRLVSAVRESVNLPTTRSGKQVKFVDQLPIDTQVVATSRSNPTCTRVIETKTLPNGTKVICDGGFPAGQRKIISIKGVLKKDPKPIMPFIPAKPEDNEVEPGSGENDYGIYESIEKEDLLLDSFNAFMDQISKTIDWSSSEQFQHLQHMGPIHLVCMAIVGASECQRLNEKENWLKVAYTKDGKSHYLPADVKPFSDIVKDDGQVIPKIDNPQKIGRAHV